MVGVVAAQIVHMQADRGVIGEALKELVDQIDIELADQRPGKIHFKNQAGSP